MTSPTIWDAVDRTRTDRQYEPGDVLAAWIESQPAIAKITQHRVIDAALGTVEKGWYHNDDSDNTQRWLPDGPIPPIVTWTLGSAAPPRPTPSAPTAGRSPR